MASDNYGDKAQEAAETVQDNGLGQVRRLASLDDTDNEEG